MSGPVELADLPDTDWQASPERAEVLIDSRLAQVGSMKVRRGPTGTGRGDLWGRGVSPITSDPPRSPTG
jgi:hypothetical protein